MSLTVDEIFERTRRVLLDEDGVRWVDAELLDWYNEGLLDAVTRKPALLTSVDTFACVAGAQQAVPVDRIALVNVGRNMGPAATPKSGLIPQIINRELMDRLIPTWMTDAANSVITAIIGSPVTPRIFYVYPQQPETNPGRLEIIFSKYPTVVSAATSAFELPDEHAPVLIEYLLYRCFLKDTDNPSAAQRSSSHLTNYLGLLGANQQPQPQG